MFQIFVVFAAVHVNTRYTSARLSSVMAGPRSVGGGRLTVWPGRATVLTYPSSARRAGRSLDGERLPGLGAAALLRTTVLRLPAGFDRGLIAGVERWRISAAAGQC